MKRAFTIYVPDDCILDALHMTVIVKRQDGSENGCTFFTRREDIRNDDKWLFVVDDKARRVDESEEQA